MADNPGAYKFDTLKISEVVLDSGLNIRVQMHWIDNLDVFPFRNGCEGAADALKTVTKVFDGAPSRESFSWPGQSQTSIISSICSDLHLAV